MFDSSMADMDPLNSESTENLDLGNRLQLYQVFLKLYEHNRPLLNEILDLENGGNNSLDRGAAFYIQGIPSPQHPYLISNLVEGKTQALLQPQATWIIGRDKRDRQVTMPISDRRLSRRHAMLQFVDGKGFYLTDCDSTNGSFVNGEPVWEPRLLKDGDRIRLGSLSFHFFLCAEIRTLASIPTSANSSRGDELSDLDDENTPDIESTAYFLRSATAGDPHPSTPPFPLLTPDQQSEILNRLMER